MGEIAKQQSVGVLGEEGKFGGVEPTSHKDATANTITEAKKYLKQWIEEEKKAAQTSLDLGGQ